MIMIRTEAVTEIPPAFLLPFRRRYVPSWVLITVLLGNHCLFQHLSQLARLILFTLRFTDGLLESWSGPGG
eukprot:COSAG01_NODE_14391_length_1460_cov_2.893461_2_plen_71_part_00